ncbi:hypothetical protein GCM10019016_036740 [Streptomyces prasinosporus]|uniref:Uncharacterized protein n=1 Tax=Streptomyces prasinosporus TaxID=68256 RepID=A0ABP6TPY7_9ACTN
MRTSARATGTAAVVCGSATRQEVDDRGGTECLHAGWWSGDGWAEEGSCTADPFMEQAVLLSTGHGTARPARPVEGAAPNRWTPAAYRVLVTTVTDG